MSIMKFFVNLLSQAVHPTPIVDNSKITASYKYWRVRIFYSMFVGYAFFYFTRKSYNFVVPFMLTDLGLSKSQVGLLGSALYLSYGVSKFASSVMSEYANPRYFMACGLIITGVINLCFGYSSSVPIFVILCAINGWFQGWGWPPCAKLLTYWYSKNERGLWWSVCSTSHGVGGMLIPLLAGRVAELHGWRWGMYFPGILGICIGIFLLNRLRDIPQSLGLPAIEEFRNDYSDIVDSELDVKNDSVAPNCNLPVKELLFKYVLNNKWVWLLSVSYFFVYVVRAGINDWAHIFLIEAKEYKVFQANAGIFWFEIGGIFGMLAAGFGSDTLFKGNRTVIVIAYAVGLLIALPSFWLAPKGAPFLDYSLMAIIGFLVFGPQMIIGLAVAEFVDKRAACTANGFAGFFANIGSALAQYPIGLIIDRWSWYGYFACLVACTGVVLLIAFAVRPAKSMVEAALQT